MPEQAELHRKSKLVAGTALAQHQVEIIRAEGIMLDNQVFLPRYTEHELAFIVSEQATLCHCTPLHSPGSMMDGRPGSGTGL